MPARLIFDHYRVCQRDDGSRVELGRGEAGVTFKAVDVNLECPVALKVLDAERFRDDAARTAFVREARAAARLRHRHIASVYHLGSDAEHFFYAMEWVEGETVDALVKRTGPLLPDAALRIALQVAQALAAANRAEIVHGDLKPANLLISADPSDAADGMFVKVINLGLAYSPHDGGRTESAGCGAPEYASPERIEERELDARSDIYSLGCILWFLLTGHPPFIRRLADLTQGSRSEPRWEELESFPAGLSKLLRIMLRRNPAERPRDGIEVQRAIELCLGRVERRRNFQAYTLRPLEDARRWMARRSRMRTATLAAVAVLALIFGLGTWAQHREESEPAPLASLEAVGEAEAPTESVASPKAEVVNVGLQQVALQDAHWLAGNRSDLSQTTSPEVSSAEEPVPTDSLTELPPVAALDSADEGPDAATPAPLKKKRTSKGATTRTSGHAKADEGWKAPLIRVHRSVKGFFVRLF